uniref:Uncharacterized protein n=1 Tax=Strigamia maritima TaxID=126957 RepID=T1JKR0_STRMM
MKVRYHNIRPLTNGSFVHELLQKSLSVSIFALGISDVIRRVGVEPVATQRLYFGAGPAQRQRVGRRIVSHPHRRMVLHARALPLERHGGREEPLRLLHPSQLDDAHDDDDDADERHHAHDHPDDERVHGVERRALIGVRVRIRSGVRFEDHLIGRIGASLARRRRFRRRRRRRRRRLVARQILRLDLHEGCSDSLRHPNAKWARVAVAFERIGRKAVQPEAVFAFVHEIDELRRQVADLVVGHIDGDLAGHGQREEDGRKQRGHVGAVDGDADVGRHDAGHGVGGHGVQRATRDAQSSQPRGIDAVRLIGQRTGLDFEREFAQRRHVLQNAFDVEETHVGVVGHVQNLELRQILERVVFESKQLRQVVEFEDPEFVERLEIAAGQRPDRIVGKIEVTQMVDLAPGVRFGELRYSVVGQIERAQMSCPLERVGRDSLDSVEGQVEALQERHLERRDLDDVGGGHVEVAQGLGDREDVADGLGRQRIVAEVEALDVDQDVGVRRDLLDLVVRQVEFLEEEVLFLEGGQRGFDEAVSREVDGFQVRHVGAVEDVVR